MSRTLWIGSHEQDNALSHTFDQVDKAVESLRFHRTATGGIQRLDVLQALRPGLETIGFECPEESIRLAASVRDGSRQSLSFTAMSRRAGTALDLHAGRAHTNNEALFSVLRFAAADGVAAGVLVVPYQYKGSTCALNVVARVEDLRRWRGVELSLSAVHIAWY